jgi:iron(III) transport system substrate-binding protein
MSEGTNMKKFSDGGKVLALVTTFALIGTACGGENNSASTDEASSAPVVVYTGRHYGIEPVFEEFTKQTGIEVRFTTGSDPELRARLEAEKANTPADLIMTADAANIELAAKAGLLSPVDSALLASAIPEELRAADSTWFAISRRLRVIMTSSERVTAAPQTYAEVGDPKWRGKLCLRPSTHPYTQSLVAGMINNIGADATRKIVDSWVSNNPLYINSDTDMLKAIKAGDCDVALTNSYYLGRLLSDDKAFPVTLTWPDQATTGAHLNISAAAVTANAPNRAAAVALLEWLATKGQNLFSSVNNEFPANPEVDPEPIIAGFGSFVADTKSVRLLGSLNQQAVELLSAAKYQ